MDENGGKGNNAEVTMKLSDITFRPGEKIKTATGYIKVMAFVDGYVMARNKGCHPFCESYYDFRRRVQKEKIVA